MYFFLQSYTDHSYTVNAHVVGNISVLIMQYYNICLALEQLFSVTSYSLHISLFLFTATPLCITACCSLLAFATATCTELTLRITEHCTLLLVHSETCQNHTCPFDCFHQMSLLKITASFIPFETSRMFTL